MSQYVETPCKTFTAGGAIAKHKRVKLSAGVLAAAGVADDWIGTMETASLASGDKVPVRLRSAQGTVKMVAAGAVTAGAVVYGAASGNVDDAVTTEKIGIALEAANDADEIIEVLQCPGVSGGFRIAKGVHTTVAASDTVATGLNTVIAVVVSFKDPPVEAGKFVSADIGDQAGAPVAGSFLLKTHKDTDADAAIVDATTFSLEVTWIAIGT